MTHQMRKHWLQDTNSQILISAIGGIVFGLLLSQVSELWPQLTSRILKVCSIVGGLFISLLKMILIPLVFVSITAGIANLRRHRQIHRVWRYALLYYFSTTALAVALGLLVVNIFKPGIGLSITSFQQAVATQSVSTLSVGGFIENFLKNLFINPFHALSEAMVLATIVFAIFLGMALIKAGEKQAPHLLAIIDEAFTVIMIMVQWVMALLPIGIFALLTKLIATQDMSLLSALAKFIVIVLGATLFHGFIVLPIILKTFTRYNLKNYYRAMRQALITAFSTSSSSATLPVTYRSMTEDLKVDKDIAGFILPLGATINMDGTALYEAIAALFIANLSGIELHIGQQLIVFVMSILASIGAPGIPSAGMVTMVMVLQSVGLPAEAIAILYPIDRLLDAARTMVNVKGDSIGCLIVDESLK